jgi:hypothetical protein
MEDSSMLEFCFPTPFVEGKTVPCTISGERMEVRYTGDSTFELRREGREKWERWYELGCIDLPDGMGRIYCSENDVSAHEIAWAEEQIEKLEKEGRADSFRELGPVNLARFFRSLNNSMRAKQTGVFMPYPVPRPQG